MSGVYFSCQAKGSQDLLTMNRIGFALDMPFLSSSITQRIQMSHANTGDVDLRVCHVAHESGQHKDPRHII